MPGKDKLGEIKTGEAADAHQGLLYWRFTFAFTVSTGMKDKYGPQPPLSEQGQKKGKRGKEGRLHHSGDATMIGPLSQCQQLKRRSTQNNSACLISGVGRGRGEMAVLAVDSASGT